MTLACDSRAGTHHGNSPETMTVGPPKIGTRICLSGHIGTIKFVGSVHGTAGTWLGIEWDDPQRGKHDGAKDGVQYFACTWVACSPVAHLSHRFRVITESQGRGRSSDRHPLSSTGQPSHELSFLNTLRIYMDPKNKKLLSSVLPMESSRSRP